MHPLFTAKTIRIVTTDSGLGGLAVAADMVEKLKINGAFRRAHVIFFNCRPSSTLGYDTMAAPEQRIRVFSRALDAMAREFAPDATLIACNTLSVLYAQTAFARLRQGSGGQARAAPAPVNDLVEIGVDLIASHLQSHPDNTVLMFAAPTTVQSNIHRELLTKRGFSAEQTIYQNCGGLPDMIENGAQEQHALIDQCVAAAVEQAPDRRRPRIAALLCTHFGFALAHFLAAFKAHGVAAEPVLDPTPQMASAFLGNASAGRFTQTAVTVEVVSQTIIPPLARSTIGGALESRSPQTAEALRRYAYRPGLFTTD